MSLLFSLSVPFSSLAHYTFPFLSIHPSYIATYLVLVSYRVSSSVRFSASGSIFFTVRLRKWSNHLFYAHNTPVTPLFPGFLDFFIVCFPYSGNSPRHLSFESLQLLQSINAMRYVFYTSEFRFLFCICFFVEYISHFLSHRLLYSHTGFYLQAEQ